MVYVVIETADVELQSIRVLSDRAAADKLFSTCAEENQAAEVGPADLERELPGTLRFAWVGDYHYCVQLLERELDDES